jgi:hypothetical protein
MTVIICPGVHPPELTERFLQGCGERFADYLVFPSETAPPYSALHVLDFLHRQFAIPHPVASRCNTARAPLLFISFSAGVVGAIGAAWVWQSLGRTVKAFIALDGWGVPLYGNFPIHRLSHDAFSHHSSAWWSQPGESFYADPPVPHLELWQSPQTAHGWRVSAGSPFPNERRRPPIVEPVATTAAEFLLRLLARYEELLPASSHRSRFV